MHRLRKRLLVELPDLVLHRFRRVHARIALHRVVIRPRLVLGLVPLDERLHRRIRRIGGQADVRDDAVGRFAGELDHLLVGQRRFADDRLVVALLAQFAQRTGRLLLVGVDEQRVGVRLLDLEHRPREIDLAGIGRDVGDDLDALRFEILDDRVAAALAEVVVDVDHRDGLRLDGVLDVARDLRHRCRLRERATGRRTGLPCCVIAAASPPMMFGTSARRVSVMLTRIEPENTGPMTR